MVPVAGIVAIVATATVVVAAIDPNPIDAMVIVCARIIGTSATCDVGPLHVAAISAPGYNPHSVAFGHDGAPTPEIVLNPHSVPVDDADLSARSKVCRPATLQVYRATRSAAAAHASAIIRGVSAMIATRTSTPIAGRVPTSIVGHVSVTVTARASLATAEASTSIASVPGTAHRSTHRTPLAMRVFVTRT